MCWQGVGILLARVADVKGSVIRVLVENGGDFLQGRNNEKRRLGLYLFSLEQNAEFCIAI